MGRHTGSSCTAFEREPESAGPDKGLDIGFFIHRFGDVEDLRDERVRLLLQALLEQWARDLDQEVENRFLRSMGSEYAGTINNLVELNQIKNRLLGMASHDLRNPLISVRGLSEILLTGVTGELTEGQKEYLSIISSASNGMLALVNDLLDISVIESGKLVIEKERGCLGKLVEERIQVYGIIAEEKGIQLSAMYGDVPDLDFDSKKISQVIDNLLSNAIKFSPAGSEIKVLLDRVGNVARFGVQDRGPGIPPEDVDRIFNEFEKSRVRPTAGELSTGLGLAIARRIIDAHEGVISVQNLPEGGALFSFSIPLKDFYNDRHEKAQGDDSRR